MGPVPDELGEAQEMIRRLRRRVRRAEASTQAEPFPAENIVWVFGSPKTGSTWLASMIEELEGHSVWREPLVGELFGRLHYNWAGTKHFESKHFILGARQKESWLKSMRSFVLSEAGARFPEVADGGFLTVREPNGSIGAPLLMRALPESRMVFLIRDPRDVVASFVDSAKKGSYMHERKLGSKHTAMFEMQPDRLVENAAINYLHNVGNTKEAHEAHEGRKVLLRYEDLRASTLETLEHIYAALEIAVDKEELKRAVEKHAWENVPEEKKGSGKFYRKASPGAWRGDLTLEQVRVVERITAPLLAQFYP